MIHTSSTADLKRNLDNMTDTYTPPKVWKWDKESGGRFAAINRPIAGATHEKDLPEDAERAEGKRGSGKEEP